MGSQWSCRFVLLQLHCFRGLMRRILLCFCHLGGRTVICTRLQFVKALDQRIRQGLDGVDLSSRWLTIRRTGNQLARLTLSCKWTAVPSWSAASPQPWNPERLVVGMGKDKICTC